MLIGFFQASSLFRILKALEVGKAWEQGYTVAPSA